MQGILTSSSPGESKLRRRRRGPVYLLRAVWFGVAVLVVELMLPAIRPAYARSFKKPPDRLKELKELEKRIFHVVDLLDQGAMAKQIGEQKRENRR